MLLSFIVIFILVNISSAQVLYSPCYPEFTIAQDNLNHQHTVAYNNETNEYFVAYIEQTSSSAYPQTSLYGMRLDGRGNVIGNRIPIFTTSDSPFIKQFPKVVYNSISKYYLVLFQFDLSGNGSDYDILARRIASNGTLMDVGAYLITSFGGNQDYPDIAFNWRTNSFVTVFQYSDDRGKNLGIMYLNGQGAPVSLQVIGTTSPDLTPHIVFNPVTISYFMVLEVENGGQGDIAGAQITSNGIPNLQLYPIGYFQFNNGTVIHEHDPEILYDPNFDDYMVSFELYLGGPEYISDVVAVPVDPSGLTYGVFSGLTDADLLIEHSTFAFSVPGGEYFYVMEIQNLTNPYITDLRTTLLDSATLAVLTPLTIISNHGMAHHPELAANTKWNEMLILFNHGNETTAFTTGQVTSGAVTTSQVTSGGVTSGSATTSQQTSSVVTTGDTPVTSGEVTTGGTRRRDLQKTKPYQFTPNHKRKALSMTKFFEQTFEPKFEFIETPSTFNPEEYKIPRQSVSGLDMQGIIMCSPSSTTQAITSSSLTSGSLTSGRATTASASSSGDNISGQNSSDDGNKSKSNKGVVAAVTVLVILVVALGTALLIVLVIRPYLQRRKAKKFEQKFGADL